MGRHAVRQTEPSDSDSRRVLLVTPQPFYEDRGSPIAVRHVLNALVELGYEVDVVAFPFGRTLDMPGVRYIRIGNPLGFKSIPIGFSLRKLFLDVLLAVKLFQCLRRNDYLYVHALEEAAFPAVWIGQRRGTFVLYDMQSSLPEQLAQSFLILRSRLMRKLIDRFECWLLTSADFVGCSAGLAAHVRAVAPDALLAEWYYPSDVSHRPVRDAEVMRQALGLPSDARIVLYTGSFAPYQGLDLLLDSIERVCQAEPSVHFVLVGADSTRELETMRSSLDPVRASRVHLLPRVPREQIPDFLALADVVVSTRRNSRNIPLKVFDYLAAGVTIIATDDAAHRVILNDEIALLAEPSPYAFARALISILGDRDLARQLAAGALDFSRTKMGRTHFFATVGRIVESAAHFDRMRSP